MVVSISDSTKPVTLPIIATALSITTYINYPGLLDTNDLGWDANLSKMLV